MIAGFFRLVFWTGPLMLIAFCTVVALWKAILILFALVFAALFAYWYFGGKALRQRIRTKEAERLRSRDLREAYPAR